jgi:hypothetical protein
MADAGLSAPRECGDNRAGSAGHIERSMVRGNAGRFEEQRERGLVVQCRGRGKARCLPRELVIDKCAVSLGAAIGRRNHIDLRKVTHWMASY